MKLLFRFLLLVSVLSAQTARYPAAVATNGDLTDMNDRAQSTLAASMSSTATTFTLASGTRFSANMIVTVGSEQIKVCQVVSNTATVGHASCPNLDGRGFAGTSAASHASGSLVSNFVTAYPFRALREEIKAIETALGPNLANVGVVANLAADGLTNVAPAIQSRINELAATTGGTLLLPPGTFLLDGSGTELLKFPGPKTVRLIGSGWATVLLVKSTVGATVDVIRVAPASEGMTGFVLSDLTIKPQSGTPARHAVVIDSSDYYIANLLIHHVRIWPLGGRGIKSVNAGLTDGFFTSTFEDSFIDNGIQLNKVGDAVNILRNSITGANIGIEVVDFVPGARALVVEGNTITSLGAAIKIGDYHTDCMIRENRLEALNGTAGSNSAYLDIDGGTNGGTGMQIFDNSISTAAAASPLVSGLRIGRATGTVVRGNTFQRNPSGGPVNWFTTASAVDSRILTNRYSPVTDVYPATWSDAGVSTYVEPRCEGFTILGSALTGTVTSKQINLSGHPLGAYIEGTRVDLNTTFSATGLTGLLMTLGDDCCDLGYYDLTPFEVAVPTQLFRRSIPAAHNGSENPYASSFLAYFVATYTGGANFSTNPVTGSLKATVCWGVKPLTAQQ